VQKFERILVFILLLLATGAGQAFLADPDALSPGAGQPLTEAAFALFYLALILLLVKYRSTSFRLLLSERWLAVICVWALASVAWSVGPGESLRRALALIGTTLAGLYLGLRFEPKQQLKMIAYAIGLGAIASLLVILAIPSVGITPDGMQGVYNLKNSLGRMMSLGVLSFALLTLGQRRHRGMHAVMFLLCGTLLVLSRSATAIVVTMLLLALLPFRKLLYLRTRQLLATTAIMIPLMAVITIWAVESSEEILQYLGRNATLSGRIPLWDLVLKSIADRPILGYGFTAFWNSWPGERVSDAANWDHAVPHAHNGFLEVWLGLGIVGLAILLISLARNFVFALRLARSRREMEFSWPLLLVIFTALYNLTENSFLVVNSTAWIAYCAASYWLAATAREEVAARQEQPDAEPAFSS